MATVAELVLEVETLKEKATELFDVVEDQNATMQSNIDDAVEVVEELHKIPMIQMATSILNTHTAFVDFINSH